jgi:hypothetical protein
MDLHLIFLQHPSTDSTGTAAVAAKYLDAAILIKDVQAMVISIANLVKVTNGRIKTLTIVGHGLDNPSGPDDPYVHISIGEETIRAADVPKHPWLWAIRPFFQRDAVVYLKACDGGMSPTMLRAFSALWGGVKVVAWTEGIAVCDSLLCWIVPQAHFQRGITEHGGKLVCRWNTCAWNNLPDEEPEFSSSLYVGGYFVR